MNTINRRALLLSLSATLALSVVDGGTASAQPGQYFGELDLTPSETPDDGRHFKTTKNFGFITQNGIHWPGPIGTVTDGASIPRFLWPIVGGPFEGKYRSAAVIHDYYCDVRVRTWEEVDRMFYEAMISGGVDEVQAQTIYFAVRTFGPHWDKQTIINSRLPPRWASIVSDPDILVFVAEAKDGKTISVPARLIDEVLRLSPDAPVDQNGNAIFAANIPKLEIPPPPSAATVRTLANRIRSGNFTLEQIDALSDRAMRQ